GGQRRGPARARGDAPRAGRAGRRRCTDPHPAGRAHDALESRDNRAARAARDEQRRIMKEARRQLVYEVVRRTARGESGRGIARALGIAPKTVKKILVREELRRTEGESALD